MKETKIEKVVKIKLHGYDCACVECEGCPLEEACTRDDGGESMIDMVDAYIKETEEDAKLGRKLKNFFNNVGILPEN